VSRVAAIAVLLAGSFLLGAGAHAVASRSRASVPPPAVAGAGSAGGAVASPGETGAAVATVADEARADPSSSSAADPALIAELSARLADLPPPAAIPGNGAIEGTVVVADEGAIAGIRVRAVPSGLPPGHAGTTENLQARDFARYIVDRTAEHRHRHAGGREAISDSTGRFRIDGLSGVPYRIEVAETDFESSVSVDGRLRTWVHSGEHVEITLTAICSVPVEVIGPDGHPAASATVDTDSGDEHPWSPESPEIRVAAGWRWISASIDGESSSGVWSAIYPGRIEPVVLRIESDPGTGIDLTVRLPEGENPESVSIRWLAIAPGETPSEERLRRNVGEQVQNHSIEDFDDLGAREIHSRISVPAGVYAVAIGRGDDAIEATATATVLAGLTALSMDLPTLRSGSSIALRVFGPGGEPVEDFEVTPYLESGTGRRFLAHTLTLRSDGIAEVSLATDGESSSAGGPLWISVRSDDYGYRTVPVDGESVTVRFEEPARLVVVLGDPDGAWGDFGADLFDEVGSSHEFDARGGDREDELHFHGLQPGDYWLEVQHGNQLAAGPIPVRLGPGENRVAVPLPSRLDLEVELPEEHAATARLSLVPLGSSPRSGWQRSKHGRRRGAEVTFTDILPGAYSLIAEGPEGSSVMPLTIERSERVRFRAAPRSALLVRHYGLPRLDGEGLRDGDLVIGWEGAEFASGAELEHALRAFLEEARWSLLVERPGTGRLAIEVEGPGYRRWSGGGLYFLRVGRD